MNLSFTPCFYHPDRVATTTCDRCRRPICLEDNRKDYSRSRYGSRIYCPVCYDSLNQFSPNINPLRIIIPFFVLAGLFIFGIFSLVFNATSDSFIPDFFVFFFGSFFLMAFFIFWVVFSAFKPKRSIGKKSFNLYGTKNYSSQLYSKNTDLSFSDYEDLHCYQCGSPISLKDKYCLNCGDPTKEEIDAYMDKNKY